MFVRGNRVRDSVASRVMGRNFTSGILEIRPTLPGQKERETSRIEDKRKDKRKGKENAREITRGEARRVSEQRLSFPVSESVLISMKARGN